MPFTTQEFFEVFRRYNTAVWPMQLILYGLAIVAVLLVVRGRPRDGRVVSAILAFLWLWMAVAYHFAFFAAINPAANLFGALFLVEALLLVLVGVRQSHLTFRFRVTASHLIGIGLIVYALLIYPILGWLLGHRYPDAPTFGLPCPTTIFTFGALCCSEPRSSLRLLAVPAVWSILGISAALQLGVIEDFGLPVAAVLTIVVALLPRRREGMPLTPTDSVSTVAR